MKNRKAILTVLGLLLSGSLYAGGTAGGSSGVGKQFTLEVANVVMVFDARELQPDEYRRALARSDTPAGAEVLSDGERVPVQKIEGNLFDSRMQRIFLPEGEIDAGNH